MNEKIRETIENYVDDVRKVYKIGIPFSESIEQFLFKLGGSIELVEMN